jgi:hypothetical protein
MAGVERVVEVPGGTAVSSRDGSIDLTGRDRDPDPGNSQPKLVPMPVFVTVSLPPAATPIHG